MCSVEVNVRVQRFIILLFVSVMTVQLLDSSSHLFFNCILPYLNVNAPV
jgi:hypothetical protein